MPTLDEELNDLRERCLRQDPDLTIAEYKHIVTSLRGVRALSALTEDKPKGNGKKPKVSGVEAMKLLDDLLGE